MNNIVSKIKRRIKHTIKVCWPTLLIIFLYLVLFTQVRVASGSMEPTLMTGDRCMLHNVWMVYKPQRGDIVGFTMGNEIWIKRVIGLPGDRVEIQDGLVSVNGELLDEDYLPENTFTNAGTYDTYTVPEGHLFLLGDNRGNSYDGRYWTEHYMPISRIIGKYGFTIWHNKKPVEPAIEFTEPSAVGSSEVDAEGSEMQIVEP